MSMWSSLDMRALLKELRLGEITIAVPQFGKKAATATMLISTISHISTSEIEISGYLLHRRD